MANETTPEMPSELFFKLHDEVYHALYFDGIDVAVEKLESIVEAPGNLSQQEQSRFKDMLLIYRRAADVDYSPARVNHELDIYPLRARYQYDCFKQPEKAERTLWIYIQYCPFGTNDFHDAAEMLVRHAMWRGNLPLARHAAQLLLHHYAILNMLRHNPCMPVTWSNDEDCVSNENMFPLSLPYWEAVEALKTEDAQC